MNTSRVTLSLFIIRLIDNGLLYARSEWDQTQTLQQLFFQITKKMFQVVLFYLFVANSFTSLLALKPLNLYGFKK